MSKNYVIGIDLGGTNARAAVVDRLLNVSARKRCPTPVSAGFRGIMITLANLVDELLAENSIDKSEVAGICAACPGALDGDAGILFDAPNLKWKNAPVSEVLGGLTGIKTLLENDANAAGYGEFIAGAGRGAKSMIMMTLGTGVGGAVIIDGKLLRGATWTGGELGHVVVQDGGRLCGCGQRGCIEAYASATATVARFVERRETGQITALTDEKITCADIFKAAQNGDPLALEIVDSTAHYIAITASNMANLLNPDRFVIGGGVIQAGEFLFAKIRDQLYRRPFEKPVKHLQVLPATLGEDAGVVGAAGAAMKLFET